MLYLFNLFDLFSNCPHDVPQVPIICILRVCDEFVSKFVLLFRYSLDERYSVNNKFDLR